LHFISLKIELNWMQNLYKTSVTSMMIMDKTLISMMSISYKMNTSEVQNCSQMCIKSICVCVVALYLIVMSKCLLKRMEKDIYISNREGRERERKRKRERERERLYCRICVCFVCNHSICSEVGLSAPSSWGYITILFIIAYLA
jgi:hypothetical protein